MSRQVKVFISYRRDDDYLKSNPDFVQQLHDAFLELGAAEVFVDTGDIKAGDEFEGTIFAAIAECDLFVELIGTRWLELLHARRDSGERDILVREIETAFALDKDIVPLLIDGARTPHSRDLPKEIQQLPRYDAKSLDSSANFQQMSDLLADPLAQARKTRKLGWGWVAGYAAVSALVWLLVAVLPNAVGLQEFGVNAWSAMAAIWAGMFVWPLFFMPFILMALYKPITVMFEAAINARTLGMALTYTSPLIAGIVLAAGMTSVETASPQTPWTIHPSLGPGCSGPPDVGPQNPAARIQYERDKQTLRTYRAGDVLPRDLQNERWAAPGERCWPDPFFYLTTPLAGRAPTPAYLEERPAVQQAFIRLLEKVKGEYKSSDAPYSGVFPYYALSFFLISTLLTTATFMAFVFVSVKIRRARDGRVLRSPTEDLFLCLMFCFIIMMVWAPFRINTINIKALYNCVDPLAGGCSMSVVDHMKNSAFFLLQLFAFLPVIYIVFRGQRRLRQIVLAIVSVLLTAGIVVALVFYSEQIVELLTFWQFWLVISLFGVLFIVVLWIHFNPAMVRLRDFKLVSDPD